MFATRENKRRVISSSSASYAVRLLAACFAATFFLALNPDSTASQQSKDETVFRVGYPRSVYADVNINDATAALKVWGEALCRKRGLSRSLEPIFFDDMDKLREALDAGSLDFVAVPTCCYLDIEDALLSDELYVTTHSGQYMEEYLLLVGVGSEIKSISELCDRTLMFLDTGRTGELAEIWLYTCLAREGLPPPTEFLARITKVTKSSRALLPVFFKQADACLVTRLAFETMSELNPQVGRDLTVIASSDPLLPSVFGPTHGVDPEVKKQVLESVLVLHEEPDGQQMLMTFKADRMIACERRWLDSVRSLMAEYKNLIGRAGPVSMRDIGRSQSSAQNAEAGPDNP